MTLQDRAAHWLRTVADTYAKVAAAPWEWDCQRIKSSGGIFGMKQPMYISIENAWATEYDLDAITKAPTHLSEGQALVRELLADIAAKDQRIDTLAGRVRYYKSKLDAAQTASEGE